MAKEKNEPGTNDAAPWLKLLIEEITTQSGAPPKEVKTVIDLGGRYLIEKHKDEIIQLFKNGNSAHFISNFIVSK
jgi:hypothetical protein